MQVWIIGRSAPFQGVLCEFDSRYLLHLIGTDMLIFIKIQMLLLAVHIIYAIWLTGVHFYKKWHMPVMWTLAGLNILMSILFFATKAN